MVLTRLSHVGEVCPLSEHSYSDTANHSPSCSNGSETVTSNKKCSSVATLPKPAKVEVVATYRVQFLDLPTEILVRIFGYLSYKNVGDIRRICKRFEVIGANILNTAFQHLQNEMLQRFHSTKSQMPRRESARRKHPLARESDILETLHMRLTLLQMSFGKHIERKHCCFFAGEILDEVHRILKHIKATPNLGRAYKVTDELCDLSTMAMEYFKEKIEPRLPEITYFGSEFLDVTSQYPDGNSGRSSIDSGFASEPEDDVTERELLPPTNMVLRKRIRRIRQGMKRYNTQLVGIRRDMKGYKTKISDQQKQLFDYTTRLDEYDRKFDESSRKFNTLFQELNRCKTELQYWRSKSPGHGNCYNCERISKSEDGSGPSELKTPAAPMAQGNIASSSSMVRNLERYFDIDMKHISGKPPTENLIGGNGCGVNQQSKQDAFRVLSVKPLFEEEVKEPIVDIQQDPNETASMMVAISSSCSSGSSSNKMQESTNINTSTSTKHPLSDSDDCETDHLHSSDDDFMSDDTVGRRVRERKRVKIDPLV